MCSAHMGAFIQVTLISSETLRDFYPDSEENDQQSQRVHPCLGRFGGLLPGNVSLLCSPEDIILSAVRQIYKESLIWTKK